MRAVTDSGPAEMNQEKPEPIQNLFNLMKVVSAPETVTHFDEAYNNCTIRYGDMKKQLAEDIVRFTAPFYEKINELSKNEAYIQKYTEVGEGRVDAPYKKTEAWAGRAMKEQIAEAVKNDYDRVAWIPGDIQNERYPGMGESEKEGMRKSYDKMLVK